ASRPPGASKNGVETEGMAANFNSLLKLFTPKNNTKRKVLAIAIADPSKKAKAFYSQKQHGVR
ncbi:hypothetical protein, partial [Methylomonas sp. MgM2]